MPASVFIDGQAGTIGLRIHELLDPRTDITILRLPDHRRKDPLARKEMLNACDIAILCLPDVASRDSVSLVDNSRVRIIDGSTAFRVDPKWVYGLPELAPNQRSAVRTALRVSNPGCWATCVCLLTRPLMTASLLPKDFPFTVHGVSGYTGGGKAAIQRWESPASGLLGLPFEALYALENVHKHIPEMRHHGLLGAEPYFRPSIGAFARGMRVEIPLHRETLPAGLTTQRIQDAYSLAYKGEPFVRFGWELRGPQTDELRFDPRMCNNTNEVILHVITHPSRHLTLIAILDNLGKGASGAAVQSLNLMLGIEEGKGLSRSDLTPQGNQLAG